jgi:hypothetical protein
VRRFIWISDNAALHHLASDALTRPTTMSVVRNHVLPACEVAAPFARIPGSRSQQGNDDTASSTP